jgi:hypothetical protein
MERRDFIKTAGATTLAIMAAGSLSNCNSPASEQKKNESGKSKVFMTKDISGKGLAALYKVLGKQASGKVAIKMHWGEPGNVNYLRPKIVRELCMSLNATLVDSNVFYNSPRQTTVKLQLTTDILLYPWIFLMKRTKYGCPLMAGNTSRKQYSVHI